MLKKKNIAMMMAVATVATTAAPAFAAVETQYLDEAAVIEAFEALLAVKYSDSKENGLNNGAIAQDDYDNCVYEITVGGTHIKSVAELKSKIENSKVTGQDLILSVKDKGHAKEDGKIVSTEVNDYLVYDNTNKLPKNGTKIGTIIGTVSNDGTKATIELANGDEIVVANGDYVLDLNKPVDKNGNLIDVATTDRNTANKVVGFEKSVDPNGETRKDIPSKDVKELVYGVSNVAIEEKLSTFVTEEGYTEDGAYFITKLLDAKDGVADIVKDGKTYTIGQVDVANDISNVVASKDGGYELTMNLSIVAKGATQPTSPNVKIVIKSDVQKDLADFRTYLADTAAGTVVTAGKYTSLTGDDRFETAVKISKETFNSAGSANAIVLVGENAVVDGLAASPLATQKNAPILLSKKDEVPASTMAEIKRAVAKNATVYVVGGENTISKDVEEQLIKEMNANIVRLSGDDRYETSLEIAKELTIKDNALHANEAFVVGGEGLVDAMSIAAVASAKTGNDDATPIIVTPADGLTKDAKYFIKSNLSEAGDLLHVVGGESKVSTQVIKDIKTASDSTKVNRISGADRHATNAKVIAEFYGEGAGSITGTAKIDLATDTDTKLDVFVAQDGYVGGDTKLIDALSAAPLAGKNNAPIVLATDDLTASQSTKVKGVVAESNTTNQASSTKLTKIGGGTSSTVMQKLLNLLGL